ncbi:MAG: helix-turn-helix domain-containing protein [Nocardioides sp.]
MPGSADDLLGIGEFARLSGLSIGALRHYDEVGVLRPSYVDPATSYRRFTREQLVTARLVATLRSLEVPLDEIRQMLATDDRSARNEILARHHDRLTARGMRLSRMLHHLTHLMDPSPLEEAPVAHDTTASVELDPDSQKALAKALYNRVWELLETEDRSPADVDEMINAAHASRLLWTGVGTNENLAIGDWQIARVYSTIGRAEPAVFHARRSLELASGPEGRAWLLASAHEGLARAYAVAGDRAVAGEWKAKAEAGLAMIDDPEDREVIERDIAGLPV